MQRILFESQCFGLPRPQGSLQAFINKRTGKTSYVYPKTLTVWRQSCIAAFQETVNDMGDFKPIENAVHVDLDFFFARPQKHYRADKTTLRHDAPVFHDKVPDLDKLIRGVFDAMTYGQVWADDNLAASVKARKFYTNNPADAGVLVSVSRL